MSALLAAGLAAIPYGALLGALFGPVRLAGVDYGRWYRNPAEISEGNDHSWIGLMKQVALNSARTLLLVALTILLWEGIVDAAAHGVLKYTTGDVLYFAAKIIATLFGLAIGAAIIQSLLEAIWRRTLRHSPKPSLGIRLAYPAAPAPAAALADAAPPVAGRRRLIICCDGTWNSPAQKGRGTNVVQLLRAIRPTGNAGGEPVPQIAYYHLGVGTGNFLDQLIGGGAGIGLSSSVRACYGFLVDNYRRGDEILLFGFSRGAYVVRSVAGLIGRVGLLRRENMFRFPEVWDYYTMPPNQRPAGVLDRIANDRHRDVEISCVGVWDTVGALGIPGTRICASAYSFHETALGENVRYALQALAMDERRGNFQPAVWARTHEGQVLEQVWFPGVHSNVGGGYIEHGLSDTTLLWMLSRLETHGLLDFDPAAIDAAIALSHAERPAIGKLQDSRSRFWKIIACPIPRPVGITDDSEMIHATAYDRSQQAHGHDPYAMQGRQDWLATIPNGARAALSAFEQAHGFAAAGHGGTFPLLVHPKRTLCDRFLRYVFGQA